MRTLPPISRTLPVSAEIKRAGFLILTKTVSGYSPIDNTKGFVKFSSISIYEAVHSCRIIL